MTTFGYVGRTRDGQKTTGTVEAANQAEAIVLIEQAGVVPSRIEVEPDRQADASAQTMRTSSKDGLPPPRDGNRATSALVVYYYADQHNHPVGPCTEGRLRELLEEGAITPSTWILEESKTEWQQCARVLAPVSQGRSPFVPNSSAGLPQPDRTGPGRGRQTAALVTGIVGCVFAGLGAIWSFVGGACCGWGAWPLAIVGTILGIVSVVLRRSALGWVTLGLGIFSFAWVIIQFAVLNKAATSGMEELLRGFPK